MHGERSEQRLFFAQHLARFSSRGPMDARVTPVLEPAGEACVGCFQRVEAASVEEGVFQEPKGSLDFSFV